MDPRQAAFLAKLGETFRAEAAEHLAALAEGLLELERPGRAEDTADSTVLERTFREAHSLKGAAASMGLDDVARLCQVVETAFGRLRAGTLPCSTALFDSVHAVLDQVAERCDTPGAALAPGQSAAQERALGPLQALLAATPVTPRSAPLAPPPAPATATPPEPPPRQESADLGPSAAPPQPSVLGPPRGVAEPLPGLQQAPRRPGTAESSAPPEAQRSDERPAATVRVSTERLGAVLDRAAELVQAQVAARRAVDALGRLELEFAELRRRTDRRRPRLRGLGRLTPSPAELAAELEELAEGLQTAHHSLVALRRVAEQDARSLATVVEALLEETRQALLVPGSHLTAGLAKLVRDLARGQGKEADLQISADALEGDRRIFDELRDPLVHLLRNAVDHGVEPAQMREANGKTAHARLELRLRRLGHDRMELTLSDDGAGIDAAAVRSAAVRAGICKREEAACWSDDEALEQVFRSGLTTRGSASEVSGRGLGLAIVREKVERLGGAVELRSARQRGTTFRIEVPLSIASFRGVVVRLRDQRYVLPASQIDRALRVGQQELASLENRTVLRKDDRTLAVLRLADLLGLASQSLPEPQEIRPGLILRSGERRIVVLVDEIIGEQEIAVRPLGGILNGLPLLAGATVLPDGSVLPILDPGDLLNLSERPEAEAAARPRGGNVDDARPKVLVVEDSITSRSLLKGILETAGFDVATAVDGVDALVALKASAFDLVVSDVDMPRRNGFELTALIRADPGLAQLPVVLVTALSSPQDRERGVEVGADAYIVKSSFEQSNLVETVRRLV